MFFSSWLRNRKSSRGVRFQGPRFRPRLEALEDRWLPSTLTVTSPLDDGSSGTLRATIAAAASGDTIAFDSSLNGQTITLNGNELLINKSLTIQGPDATQLAISGNHLSRVFEVAAGEQVTLAGLTIEYGNTGPSYYSDGGGIFNRGALSLSGCNFSGNSADDYGGAIYSIGSLKLDGCNFSSNSTASSAGGAIYGGGPLTGSSGPITASNCVFSNNSSGTDGGAMYDASPITASNCVFSHNSSGRNGGAIYHVNTPLSLSGCTFLSNTVWNGNGGAIFDGGGGVGALMVNLSGCTLSGNSAHYHNQPILNQTGCGGAIYTGAATTKLTDCTLSGNSAVTGGAIWSTQDKGNSLTLSGCTITSNTATSKGGGLYNFYGDASLQNTKVSNNSAGTQGGGIFNDANATLTLYSSTTVTGNSAPDGADLINLGRVTKKKG
jgi:predicted outer membrane repeat protein